MLRVCRLRIGRRRPWVISLLRLITLVRITGIASLLDVLRRRRTIKIRGPEARLVGLSEHGRIDAL
jgi:hypothetical protein